MPEPELPPERIVVDDEVAASVFHIPVALENQEIACILAKSRERPSQVVSIELVKILAAAEPPLLATSQKRPPQARYHMHVDTAKKLKHILKLDAYVKHVQKMWGDPAKDGAWGDSIIGFGSVDPDPWDAPGYLGKKACREILQKWSTSRESNEIYEDESEQAGPSDRVVSQVTRAPSKKELEEQRQLQDAVMGWLAGQPRNEDQRVFTERQLERALAQAEDDDLIDLDSIHQDDTVFGCNPFLGDDQ